MPDSSESGAADNAREVAPTAIGWTRLDRRIGAALAIGLAAAWLVAWLAPKSDLLVREVTGIPLAASVIGRIGGVAFAAFVLWQVVRHWRAPLPEGDVRTLSLPIGRAMVLVGVAAFLLGAVECTASRLDRARAERAIAAWRAQGAKNLATSRVTIGDPLRHGFFGQRAVVGTRIGGRFTRRCEAIWIDDLADVDPDDLLWLDGFTTSGSGWKRTVERLALPASKERALLVTTTWAAGHDPESSPVTTRIPR
ncbi:MAG: hypothetical protein JNL90_11015 [Planctomycetes bacterium]|nr:hypothetical protein [Planctomycetota bacterium]